MKVVVFHEYEMFSSPSSNIARVVWMLLEEDKALKVWAISICVREIEEGLKQPSVYSKLRVSSGRTDMLGMQLNCFSKLIPAAAHQLLSIEQHEFSLFTCMFSPVLIQIKMTDRLFVSHAFKIKIMWLMQKERNVTGVEMVIWFMGRLLYN